MFKPHLSTTGVRPLHTPPRDTTTSEAVLAGDACCFCLKDTGPGDKLCDNGTKKQCVFSIFPFHLLQASLERNEAVPEVHLQILCCMWSGLAQQCGRRVFSMQRRYAPGLRTQGRLLLHCLPPCYLAGTVFGQRVTPRRSDSKVCWRPLQVGQAGHLVL